jgi:cell division protein FtsA
VTQDLAIGLKVPLSRAEQLKLEQGAAFVDDEAKGRTITTTNELGLPGREINLEHLRRIMGLRLEESFELVAQDVQKAGLLQHLRGGVFLCGGGARVRDIARLAEHTFDLPVMIGKTNSISGLKSALDQPEFAAPIGLVKFGSFKSRKREGRPSWTKNVKTALTKFLQRG